VERVENRDLKCSITPHNQDAEWRYRSSKSTKNELGGTKRKGKGKKFRSLTRSDADGNQIGREKGRKGRRGTNPLGLKKYGRAARKDQEP